MSLNPMDDFLEPIYRASMLIYESDEMLTDSSYLLQSLKLAVDSNRLGPEAECLGYLIQVIESRLSEISTVIRSADKLIRPLHPLLHEPYYERPINSMTDNSQN